MFPRPRLVAAGFVLSGMLAFSLFGVVSSGASVAASGRVSAQLTKTSFTAAQATTVQLVCKFSPASTRWSYVLSLKKGAKWVKVLSVIKKGSFKGSHEMTVKKLFGSKPVKVGQYRVNVSADANSVTRKFTVVISPPGAFNKTSPANGATGQPNNPSLSWGASSNASSYEYCIDTTNNNACDGSWVSTSAATKASLSGLTLGATYYWQVHAKNAQGTTDANGGSWFSFTVSGPTAGYWKSTSLTGPVGNGLGLVTISSVFFNVEADQATVTVFGFAYSYQDSYCPGPGLDGRSWLNQPSAPIVGGQFSDPAGIQAWGQAGSYASGSGHFSGTFDSPTTAHGTAELLATIMCGGITRYQNVDMGPFSWTAAWQSAS
jgi:hypothetical protein